MTTGRFAAALSAAWLATCCYAATAADPNVLSEQEVAAGFQLLFNGKDLEGWKQSGNWVVQQGVIQRAEAGGSLVYEARKVPDNFELRFEWQVAQGSNSGVYYRPGQYEYQVLDNAGHRDGQNPRTSAASLYFCMAPSQDATKPIGEWNTARIICQGTVIQHWLNGRKVMDFDYADPKWADNVELLRLRGGNLADRGAYLSLQDHGDPVAYRGVKLRPVPADEKLDRTPVTPEPIAPDVLKAEREKLEQIIKKRQGAKKKAP